MVVETPEPVLVAPRGAAVPAGYATSAAIKAEAHGVAVVRAVGDPERVACAVWALKTIGGWEETEVMTIALEGDGRVVWCVVSGALEEGRWMVEVLRTLTGWAALLDEATKLAHPLESSALLVDVDWAKSFNDTYGFSEGDLMLVRVHNAIVALAQRAGGRVIRVGGDEFAVLLEEPYSFGLVFAEAARRAVERLQIPHEHHQVQTAGHVTLSVGVAIPNDVGTLRVRLDEALWRAKKAGRNRVAR